MKNQIKQTVLSLFHSNWHISLDSLHRRLTDRERQERGETLESTSGLESTMNRGERKGRKTLELVGGLEFVRRRIEGEGGKQYTEP